MPTSDSALPKTAAGDTEPAKTPLVRADTAACERSGHKPNGAPDNDVTDRTFQPAMFRSNAFAAWNVPPMVITLATFQLERSELKALALSSMKHMLLTLATFHLERSELKALAK
jgi:hypothetical protein